MNELQDFTKQLVNKYFENKLSYNDLRVYYKKTLYNFAMIDKFADYRDFTFAGTLFVLMLKSDNFENDPDLRQCMAAIGYYILSKGMEKYTLDIKGNYLLSNESKHVELLTPRLNILLASKQSIKYTVREILRYEPGYHIREYGDYLYDIQEGIAYENLLIYDSNTINQIGSSFEAIVKFKESVKLGTEIFENFKKHYKDLSERIELGKNISTKLYNYLKNRFEIENDFEFS